MATVKTMEPRVRLNPAAVVRLILVLSFFDAAVTDFGLRMEWITEGNPIARLLYESHIALFYTFKIALPSVLLVMIPYVSGKLLIQRLIILTAVIYVGLAMYHISWLGLVWIG